MGLGFGLFESLVPLETWLHARKRTAAFLPACKAFCCFPEANFGNMNRWFFLF